MIKEFRCDDNSEHVFERRFASYDSFVKDQSRRSVLCPKCGKRAQAIVSQTARPQFKGSGFHETDYKNG
jgi:hypothetical protein